MMQHHQQHQGEEKVSLLYDQLSEAVQEVQTAMQCSQVLSTPTLVFTQHSGPRCLSALGSVPRELLSNVLDLSRQLYSSNNEYVWMSRSVGAMVGMAVADSLGHNFEFVPACDVPGGADGTGPRFEYDGCGRGIFHEPRNQFQLKPGQWTDDASMGLCLADSILCHDKYDGSHCRILYHNWWNDGLNNAFRHDNDRKKSVGLGGNISNSLYDLNKYMGHEKNVPPKYEPKKKGSQDAGNGSLMRLCAVPIFYAGSSYSEEMARESSFATHPGPMAAEACAFVSSLIIACIQRPVPDEVIDKTSVARNFIEDFASQYRARSRDEIGTMEEEDDPSSNAKATLCRLLASSESDESTERCWNWKNLDAVADDDETQGGTTVRRKFSRMRQDCFRSKKKQTTMTKQQYGLGIEKTLRNRGYKYNGYPVSAAYFGSFSLDAVAMALYCVCNTTSFNEAVVRCINFLGDADTTGAITAQIAGAFYGMDDSIQEEWKRDLEQWDKGGFEIRAVCLAVRGRNNRAEKEEHSQ